MTLLPLPLGLIVIIALAPLIEAQCVTSGYVPCLPAGSQLGGVPQDDFDNSGFWSSLQGVANSPIGKRGVLHHNLASRQNALCCMPTVKCLVLTESNIPFCYNEDTTRYFFSDGSFGFLSNGTYYAADGTFVDYKDGYYSSTDGATGTFAPATAAATSSHAGASVPSNTVTGVTASGAGNKSPTTTSSGGGTQHTTATTSTTTSNTHSGSNRVLPFGAFGWPGLCLACLSVFLT